MSGNAVEIRDLVKTFGGGRGLFGGEAAGVLRLRQVRFDK